MMQHLAHGDVIRILQKFSNVSTTGPRRRPVYLLATTYPNTAVNARLDVHQPIRYVLQNLEVAPFRLEPPLCLFRDGPPKSEHFMGVWRLPLKAVAESSCRKPLTVSTPLSSRPVYSCTDWSLPSSKSR